MGARGTSLARLAAVQAQMTRLAEWRLAAAERACRELADDKTRLQGYVVEAGALGVPLAKAALRSLHALDERLADAEIEQAARKAALATATLRKDAIGDLAGRVGRDERRAADERVLVDVVDLWILAERARTSLP